MKCNALKKLIGLQLILLFFIDITIAAPNPLEKAIRPPTVEIAQFYNVLIRITRCTPLEGNICNFYINNINDLLYYLKNCDLLFKWNVIYNTEANPFVIELTASVTSLQGCLITIADRDLQPLQQCDLTKDNLKLIQKETGLMDYLQNFSNDLTSSFAQTPVLAAFNKCLTTRPKLPLTKSQ
ncbi:MAG: hypothetical protein M1486_06100 [Gammaproteobacteria bacterium]|nr:hypothetical protein [Gammaproteobacteria bacterium]